MARADAVGALLRRLGEAPGTDGLRGLLAQALNDPSLKLIYWIDGRWVDRKGITFGGRWDCAVESLSLSRDGSLVAAGGNVNEPPNFEVRVFAVAHWQADAREGEWLWTLHRQLRPARLR